MAPELESGVQERLESPTEGEEIYLIVEVDETSDSVLEQIESTGAIVEDTLPLDHLAVRTEEPYLQDLWALNSVLSMEVEGEGTVMGVDFHTRTG